MITADKTAFADKSILTPARIYFNRKLLCGSGRMWLDHAFDILSFIDRATRRRAILIALCLATPTANAAAVHRPLLVESQGSFFIGGKTVASETLGAITPFPPTGSVVIDQMYVHFQIPAHAHARPSIIFVHGCCLTGAAWETTPDGRMGWDEYFLRAGYPVYVIDQAWRGRSAVDVSAINAVRDGKAPPSGLPVATAASRETAWQIFRFGPTYPIAYPDLQFPLESQQALWNQMVPNFAAASDSSSPTIPALALLAKKTNAAILVSHSQSGIYPFQAIPAAQGHIKAIIAVEPASCPDADQSMEPLARVPTLILFGDHVGDSPRWSPRLQACAEFVKAARAAGVDAELLVLPEHSIKGNSHMIMQDRNSLQIAEMLVDWLRKRFR